MTGDVDKDDSASHDRSILGKILAGAYRIEAIIGRGAMGVVYRAHNDVLAQDFAVKVIAADVAHDEQVRGRLLQEARALTRLTHKNIVTVRHCGEEAGRLFVVMDLCPGVPLSEILRWEGPLPEDRAAAIVGQVCEALEEAHGRGIVHRDLKPDNIMVETVEAEDGTKRDHVRVLDFGLARVLDEARAELPGAMVSVDEQLLGTVAYMSPEQVRTARDIDGRSDVFSLGVVLYELLAGALPFGSEAPMSVIARILEKPPAPLPEGVSPGMRAIVARALEKDRDERFSSANALRDALRVPEASAGLFDVPTRGRPLPWRWIAVACAAVLAVVGGVFLFGRDPVDADRHAARAALAGCASSDAAGALTRLARAGAATPEELLQLADLRIELADAEAEQAVAEAGRALGERDPRVHLLRARLAWQTGQPLRALEHIGEAAVADPSSVEPIMLRADMLLDESVASTKWPRDRFEMFRADVESLSKRAPDDPRTLLLLGRLGQRLPPDLASVDERNGALERAAAHLREAARLDERWAEPVMYEAKMYESIAHQLSEAGRAREAEEPVANALALADTAVERARAHPTHLCQRGRSWWLHQSRGLIRWRAGDHDGAVDDARAAYAQRRDLSAFRRLANTLRINGQLEEAIDLYGQLCEATHDPQASFDLGYCWQEKGRALARAASWDEARAALDEALRAYDAAFGEATHEDTVRAYRGETYLMRADLPGGDPVADLRKSADDLDRAADLQKERYPDGTIEVEHRRALSLLRRGRVHDARRALARPLQHESGTPAVHARYALVVLCCAAERHVAGARDEVGDLVRESATHVLRATGMVSEPSAGVYALRGEQSLIAGLLEPDADTRRDLLKRAARSYAAAVEAHPAQPAWSRERLVLLAAEAGLVLYTPRGGKEAVALGRARVAALAEGVLRRDAAHYARLASALRAAEDAGSADLADRRAEVLRR